jgi:3-deoxy-D-manno-octulosonic-acid transferase
MLTRALYDLLWYAATPLLPLRLWWRGRREPGYRERIGERFGHYGSTKVIRGAVWVHAVSLGETRAAAHVVARILREMPGTTVLLTHMTATGRAAGAALAGRQVVQAWLPYDVPFAVRSFLSTWQPRAGLLMETEVWPNLVAESHAANVPLYLVNARLSERSLRGYRRFASLTEPMFASLAGVAAQTEADAQRLREAGAHDVACVGNVKFDVRVDDGMRARARELRALWGDGRLVWLAASTRDGEEAAILDALARAPLPPGALTVIVPRHPQRFDEVARLIEARGLRCARRSANAPVPDDVELVLGDSVGELLAYYAACDVAFVGGSLLPHGGQNLIEALAAGVPTLVGPHTFNFAEAAAQATSAGAALRVDDAQALLATVAGLLCDPARGRRMREAALAFHGAHRGATDRLWQWLEPRIIRTGGG